MFVGDRGWTQDPFPVQPPTQNTWKWITVNVANDGGALQAFAQADTGLWQPGAGAVAREDLKVPYILVLPTVAVEFIVAWGGQCRPHELLHEVGQWAAAYDTIPAGDWSLMQKWCMVAAQAKNDGDSHVALR